MVDVNINNNHYQVHEDVYQWMKTTRDIIRKTTQVREAQKKYFRTRSSIDMKVSIALENELDNLLAGKTPEKVGQELELFR